MAEDDLLQEVLLQWLTQRERFSGDRGASIQTFFRNVAKNHLADIYREQTADKRGGHFHTLSLNQPVGDEESDGDELGDFVPDPQDVASEVEGEIERDRILAFLTPRQRELAEGLAQDYSVSEMSKKMGVPRTTLNDELSRIRRTLRKKDYETGDIEHHPSFHRKKSV